MIHELRIYRCVPGRLPDLNKRFETVTLKLWEKHGIKQAGFYTTLIGTSNQELTYFIAWDSLADREKTVSDRDLALLRGFTQGVVTFKPAGAVPPLLGVAIVLASAMVAYVPTTHMSHFFTKWFMYHDVRWNDEVNTVGSKLEKRIQAQLAYKVDWAAPHIQGGGTKTWVDVATEEVGKK